MITTNYANSILNTLFGVSSSLSAPSNIYLGLSSTKPDATGGNITEPSAPSYKRTLVGGSGMSSSAKVFSSATGGIIKNTKEIQCATARESWGTLPYWFLATSETGKGEAVILSGDLTGAIAITGVAAETVPVFYENELKASIDVELS